MNEPKTEVVRVKNPEFDPYQVLSNRLAGVEASYIHLDARITALAEQILTDQLERNKMDGELAGNSVERLNQLIDDIRDKRRELIPQLARVEDPTQKIVLQMLAENFQQREQRAVKERDEAIIAAKRAGERVDGTSQKIENIKMGPPPPPPFQKSTTDKILERIWNRLEPVIIPGIFLIIIQALWAYFKSQLGSP